LLEQLWGAINMTPALVDWWDDISRQFGIADMELWEMALRMTPQRTPHMPAYTCTLTSSSNNPDHVAMRFIRGKFTLLSGNRNFTRCMHIRSARFGVPFDMISRLECLCHLYLPQMAAKSWLLRLNILQIPPFEYHPRSRQPLSTPVVSPPPSREGPRCSKSAHLGRGNDLLARLMKPRSPDQFCFDRSISVIEGMKMK
jgi:hypothetical protein